MWVWEDNLRPFLTILGWIGYDLDPDDWTAISAAMRETDQEAGRWYDYEFAGRQRTVFSRARDPDGDLVHVQVSVPWELESQVNVAAEICARFRLRDQCAASAVRVAWVALRFL